MITHESIEIFNKKIMFFLLLLSAISQNVFLHNNVLIHRLDIFLIFITKNANADGIPFFDFVNASNFDWKIYVFKIKSL